VVAHYNKLSSLYCHGLLSIECTVTFLPSELIIDKEHHSRIQALRVGSLPWASGLRGPLSFKNRDHKYFKNVK